MASVNTASDQLLVALSHPSQPEQSCPGIVLFERFQDALHIAMYSTLQRLPQLHLGRHRTVQDVKPLFDIYCQAVCQSN